jgi:hypothetical protein
MDAGSTPGHRDRRIALSLPVRISSIDPDTDHESGQRCFRASRELCGNLSRGGAYIRTAEPLSPGGRVLIEMELPGGRPFETVGRIAWSRTIVGPGGKLESGYGVEFLGKTPARAQLEQFFASAELPAPNAQAAGSPGASRKGDPPA